MGYHSTSACQPRPAKPTTTGRPFKPASTCAPTHELNRPKINFAKHAHASAAPRRHPRYTTLLPGPKTEPNTLRGSPPPRRKGGIMPTSVCKGKHQSELFFNLSCLESRLDRGNGIKMGKMPQEALGGAWGAQADRVAHVFRRGESMIAWRAPVPLESRSPAQGSIIASL